RNTRLSGDWSSDVLFRSDEVGRYRVRVPHRDVLRISRACEIAAEGGETVARIGRACDLHRSGGLVPTASRANGPASARDRGEVKIGSASCMEGEGEWV